MYHYKAPTPIPWWHLFEYFPSCYSSNSDLFTPPPHHLSLCWWCLIYDWSTPIPSINVLLLLLDITIILPPQLVLDWCAVRYTVIRGQHVLKKPFSSFIDFTRHAGSKLCHMEWKINTAVSAVCNNQHCTTLYQTLWCQRVYFSIYYSISTVPDYLVSEGLKYFSIYYLFQLWAIRLINIAYTYKF